jgi:UDP-N-acetylglucosamine 2-epimerase (non-hydrolysing)
MRIVCVAGARPNYMKVKPVMDALEAAGAAVILVHTGQHYDAAMNDVFFAELGIRPPDHFLQAGSGSHAVQTGKVMAAFEPLAGQLRPDVVVVVGDVNSTLGCALVTAKSGALLAHVEAGLRSRDWDMPEEVNRVVTDRVSDYLFAPSADAVDNLRAEGYRADQIHLAGNVMVDTLLANLDRALASDVLSRLGLSRGGYALVTLHRPANVDDPGALGTVLSALGELAQVCPIVLPAHPTGRRSAARPRHVRTGAGDPARRLPRLRRAAGVGPAGADRFRRRAGRDHRARVPCLTLRDNTGRPVTLTEGTNQLVGRNREPIVKTALSVLDTPPPGRCPALWDGRW